MKRFYRPPIANTYTFAFLGRTGFKEVTRRGEKFYSGNEEIGTFRQLASWMLLHNARYAVPVGNSGYFVWEQVFFSKREAREMMISADDIVMYSTKLGLFIRYLAEENLYVTSDGRKLEAVPEGQYCINFMADYQPGNEAAADVCDASADRSCKNRLKRYVNDKRPACRFDYVMFMRDDCTWWNMTWSRNPGMIILHNGGRNQMELKLAETALYMLEHRGFYKNEGPTHEPAIIDGVKLLEEIRKTPGQHIDIVEIKDNNACVWSLNSKAEALEHFKSAPTGKGKYFIDPFPAVVRDSCRHNSSL